MNPVLPLLLLLLGTSSALPSPFKLSDGILTILPIPYPIPGTPTHQNPRRYCYSYCQTTVIPTGAIAAIVVGSIVFVLVILIVCLRRCVSPRANGQRHILSSYKGGVSSPDHLPPYEREARFGAAPPPYCAAGDAAAVGGAVGVGAAAAAGDASGGGVGAATTTTTTVGGDVSGIGGGVPGGVGGSSGTSGGGAGGC